MKLALVFLIIGGFLLSCSLQQQVIFRPSGWNPNIFPRTMMPYYYYADQDADTNEMSHQVSLKLKDISYIPLYLYERFLF